MRTFTALATTAALLAACAPDSDKTNPAIATEEAAAEREAIAPAAGATSFTEDQARERITNAGYTDVTSLTKADDGTWRANATKGGQMSSVVMDYQGNITAMPTAAIPGEPMPADPSKPATPAPPQ
jgi:hypothetical protein